MNIDTDTGLPEVPEDYYWEIQPTKEVNGTSLTLVLFKECTDEFPVHKKRSVRTWRRLWIKEIEVYTEMETQTRPVAQYNKRMSEKEWAVGEDALKIYRDAGWELLKSIYSADKESRYLMENVWEPTAESVLAAAIEIMDEFTRAQGALEQKKTRLVAQQVLIGKYPPKVLDEVPVLDEPDSDKQKLRGQISLLQGQIKELQVKYETGDDFGDPEWLLTLITDATSVLDQLKKNL